MLRKNRSISKKIQRYQEFFREKNFGVKYSRLLGYFSTNELKALFRDEKYSRAFEERLSSLLEPVSGRSLLKKAMYLDSLGWLPHNLTVADKSSMAASIEMRVPLLSKDLLKAVFKAKDSTLISRGKLKCHLKRCYAGSFQRIL